VADIPGSSEYSRARDSAPHLGLLILRAAAGGFLLPHGLAQVLGWFGGAGLTGFAVQPRHLRLPSSAPIPFVLTTLQIILGTLLLLGVGTRLVVLLAVLLVGVIAVALLPTGWFWCGHGLEYPVFWCASLVALALTGGGQLYFDAWLKGRGCSASEDAD
jgi:putative oxidoreductase